jgi:hypothetical protein
LAGTVTWTVAHRFTTVFGRRRRVAFSPPQAGDHRAAPAAAHYNEATMAGAIAVALVPSVACMAIFDHCRCGNWFVDMRSPRISFATRLAPIPIRPARDRTAIVGRAASDDDHLALELAGLRHLPGRLLEWTLRE